MNKKHIFVLLAFCAAVALGGCSKGKILSKQTVAEIHADIYVADQYIKINQDVNSLADTTLVYNAIFEHYGCTLEDYQRSVKHYIATDKAYPEILDIAYKKIHKELERLTSLGAYNPYNFVFLDMFPNTAVPDTISLTEYNSLKGRNFWNYSLTGDTIKPFDFVASATDIPRAMFDKEGLYVGDPSKIVDDSDASEMFDDNPAHWEDDAPPVKKSKPKKGINPADRPRDPALEAKPISIQELRERQRKLKLQREEAQKQRELQKELEQLKKDRGYED